MFLLNSTSNCKSQGLRTICGSHFTRFVFHRCHHFRTLNLSHLFNKLSHFHPATTTAGHGGDGGGGGGSRGQEDPRSRLCYCVRRFQNDLSRRSGHIPAFTSSPHQKIKRTKKKLKPDLIIFKCHLTPYVLGFRKWEQILSFCFFFCLFFLLWKSSLKAATEVAFGQVLSR